MTIWEGLQFGCTSKENKEGKDYVIFMVGMTYKRGVVMCVPLQQKMIRGYYWQLVETEISTVLNGIDGSSPKILQDGCLFHNSRKAFWMMELKNIAVFAITTRPTDLNPIQNLFNQVKYQLRSISFCVQDWRCDNEIHKYWFIFQKSEIL